MIESSEVFVSNNEQSTTQIPRRWSDCDEDIMKSTDTYKSLYKRSIAEHLKFIKPETVMMQAC